MNSVGKKSKKPMISGIVIPDQWDANGKVITVTIHANDEKVFLVEHSKIGNDFKLHHHPDSNCSCNHLHHANLHNRLPVSDFCHWQPGLQLR